MMKKIILALTVVASLISVNALADQYVNGYTRSNGTYVEPYVRSSPNSTTYDNYGSRHESSSSYQTQGLPSTNNSNSNNQSTYGLQPLNSYGR